MNPLTSKNSPEKSYKAAELLTTVAERLATVMAGVRNVDQSELTTNARAEIQSQPAIQAVPQSAEVSNYQAQHFAEQRVVSYAEQLLRDAPNDNRSDHLKYAEQAVADAHAGAANQPPSETI
jgi:hypothetical protein